MSGPSPSREYINENVTPVLLEGMKILARDRPENPLQVLGHYLLEASQNQQHRKQSGSTTSEFQSQQPSQQINHMNSTSNLSSNSQFPATTDASQHIPPTTDASSGP